MKRMQTKLVLSVLAAGILALPAALAVAPKAPAAPPAPSAPAVPVIHQGLTADEMVQVAILIKNDKRIREKRILEFHVNPDGSLSVRTGCQKDQFTVRGEAILLNKRNDRWGIAAVSQQEAAF